MSDVIMRKSQAFCPLDRQVYDALSEGCCIKQGTWPTVFRVQLMGPGNGVGTWLLVPTQPGTEVLCASMELGKCRPRVSLWWAGWALSPPSSLSTPITWLGVNGAAASAAKSLQSCPTLCDPMDCSLPGFSVDGIFQARVLEWGAIAFSEQQPRCGQCKPTVVSDDQKGGGQTVCFSFAVFNFNSTCAECIFLPREWNGNPLQCSCLENFADRGDWGLQSMGLQSQIGLSD